MFFLIKKGDIMKTKEKREFPATQKVISCYYCSYVFRGDKLPKNYRCPKCQSFAFEKFYIPESIFALFA